MSNRAEACGRNRLQKANTNAHTQTHGLTPRIPAAVCTGKTLAVAQNGMRHATYGVNDYFCHWCATRGQPKRRTGGALWRSGQREGLCLQLHCCRITRVAGQRAEHGTGGTCPTPIATDVDTPRGHPPLLLNRHHHCTWCRWCGNARSGTATCAQPKGVYSEEKGMASLEDARSKAKAVVYSARNLCTRTERSHLLNCFALCPTPDEPATALFRNLPPASQGSTPVTYPSLTLGHSGWPQNPQEFQVHVVSFGAFKHAT